MKFFLKDIETSQICLMIADGATVVDCVLNLADRVRHHEEGVMTLGEQVRAKLEQILSLGQLQALASQVIFFNFYNFSKHFKFLNFFIVIFLIFLTGNFCVFKGCSLDKQRRTNVSGYVRSAELFK